MESQKIVILDQFTKQVGPFASATAMKDIIFRVLIF